jgi:hypothetical protein
MVVFLNPVRNHAFLGFQIPPKLRKRFVANRSGTHDSDSNFANAALQKDELRKRFVAIVIHVQHCSSRAEILHNPPLLPFLPQQSQKTSSCYIAPFGIGPSIST